MRTMARTLWLVALLGCGDKPLPEKFLTLKPTPEVDVSKPADVTEPVPSSGGLRVVASGSPSAVWDGQKGTTTVVARWVARRADGTPLGPNDVDVTLALDGSALDPEIILQQGSKPLAVNLTYGMVLDATYSMVLHTPPAFDPMKQAAQKSVQTGASLWLDKPGSFNWTVSWFDDYVYRPETPWADASLLSIPAPSQGAFTRLYAAVDFGLSELSRIQTEGVRDNAQDVLVVFSDGRDNHSAWTPPDTNTTVDRDGDMSYRKLSWPAQSLTDLLAKISSRPSLTVHTLGMGTDVNDEELQAIADAGHGIYAKNPHSEGVAALFERVTQEFTTLQTSGASLPNPPGDYTFTITVTDRTSHATGVVSYKLHLGDEQAGIF